MNSPSFKEVEIRAAQRLHLDLAHIVNFGQPPSLHQGIHSPSLERLGRGCNPLPRPRGLFLVQEVSRELNADVRSIDSAKRVKRDRECLLGNSDTQCDRGLAIDQVRCCDDD